MLGLGILIGIIIGMILQTIIIKLIMQFIGSHPEMLKEVIDKSTTTFVDALTDEAIASLIDKFARKHGFPVRSIITPETVNKAIHLMLENSYVNNV